MKPRTVVCFFSNPVLILVCLCIVVSGRPVARAESAASPCADPACALRNAISLLKTGDTVGAYGVFSTFATFSDADSNTAALRNYAALLKPGADRIQAHKIIREESSHQPNILPGTIAVTPFVNSGAPDNLQPLCIGLPEMLSTDLAQVKRLTVLERAQLRALSAEIALGQTGLLDTAYGSRIGRLAGAERVVSGSFGGNTQEITISCILRQTAGNRSDDRTVSAKGSPAGLFKTEKDLVFSIVSAMNIVLTDDERKAVQTIPTENVLAYLAYCKGLDAEDRGDFSTALTQYQTAVAGDANFEKAKTALGRATAVVKLGKAQRQKSDKSTTSDIKNTNVFSIGPLQFSAVGSVALESMNGVMAGFMPERPLVSRSGGSVGPANGSQTPSSGQASESERNSYLDATNTGLNSASSTVKARVPIPPAISQ
jgi:TolB-like protein